ncbi:MAG: paraquat-inducible protein A, partial [Planctomycetota bacterium]
MASGERRRELERLELLGRWSMLDVFVITILVGAAQLGILSGFEARYGILIFGAAVLLSMAATFVATHRAARSETALALSSGPLVFERPPLHVKVASVAALALFLTGIALPTMRVEKWFFWEDRFSILTGVQELALRGDIGLALALLIFVVLLRALRLHGRPRLPRPGFPPRTQAQRLAASPRTLGHVRRLRASAPDRHRQTLGQRRSRAAVGLLATLCSTRSLDLPRPRLPSARTTGRCFRGLYEAMNEPQVTHYELFADYYQFYLQDESVEGDLSDSWNDEAVAPGTLGIGTARNEDVPVVVEISSEEPGTDFDEAERIELRVGTYRVRVS